MSTELKVEDKPKKKAKPPNPPNTFMVGSSWYCEVSFKGMTFRKAIGQVSRTLAGETAAKWKSKIKAGLSLPPDERLAVNGMLWSPDQQKWVAEEKPIELQNPLFSEALDKWLRTYSKATRAESSYKTDTYNGKPLKAFFGEYRMNQINSLLIDEYFERRSEHCECSNLCPPKMKLCPLCGKRARPLAPATLRHELLLLKSLFARCLEWGMVAKDPTVTKKLSKYRPNQRERFLSPVEAQKLLLACPSDFRNVVLFALHSGFRSKEVKGLKWENVDFVNRTLTVVSGQSKNHERKTIPMSDTVYAMLSEVNKERDSKPEDYVFRSRYGRKWKSWRTAWTNACERAGLKDVNFHDLRHSFGSFLAASGVQEHGLMDLLGHKTAAMTKRYIHFADTYRRTAIANLPHFEGIAEPKSPEIPFEEDEKKVVNFVSN
jgi:integrase